MRRISNKNDREKCKKRRRKSTQLIVESYLTRNLVKRCSIDMSPEFNIKHGLNPNSGSLHSIMKNITTIYPNITEVTIGIFQIKIMYHKLIIR